MKSQAQLIFFFLLTVFTTSSVKAQPTTKTPSCPPIPPTTIYCQYTPNIKLVSIRKNTPLPTPTISKCFSKKELLLPGVSYIELSENKISIKRNGVPENSKSTSDDSNYFSSTMGNTLPASVDIALNKVFSVIADMAVDRAKSLALDLATAQLKEACKVLGNTIPSLCNKFVNNSILDLIKDRKVLIDAIVSDAFYYLAQLEHEDLGKLDLAIRILKNYNLLMTTNAINTKEIGKLTIRPMSDLVLLLSNFPDLKCDTTYDDCKNLQAIVTVGKTFLQSFLKYGLDPNLLNWPVFRDFSKPAMGDDRYMTEYNGLLQFANELIADSCSTRFADALCQNQCQDELFKSLISNTNSYQMFVEQHPYYSAQMQIFNEINKHTAGKDIPELMQWLSRFRAIFEEKDPKNQLKSSYALFMDLLIKDQRNVTLAGKLLAAEEEVKNLIPPINTQYQTPERASQLAAAIRKVTELKEQKNELDTGKTEVTRLAAELVKTEDAVRLLERQTDNLDGNAKPEKKKASLNTAKRQVKELNKKLDDAKEIVAKLEAQNKRNIARLEATKYLVLAVVEKDYAGILRAFIDLLQCESGNSDAVKKGMATLRLIIGLLEKDAEGEKPEDAQKRRVKLLEEFASEMTSRKNRPEQHIVSLGVSAMLGSGIDLTEWNFKDENEGWNPIGLSIPLGISYEYFGTSSWGFHGMIYPLDLAQYARIEFTDDSTSVPEPTIYTAFTVGIQLAVSKLFHDVPLTVGVDVRYIPALEYTSISSEAGAAEETKTQPGHFQLMFFVGFHFPLFDFN